MAVVLSLIHRSLDALVGQVSEKMLKNTAAIIAGASRVLIFGGGRWLVDGRDGG